MAGISNKLQQPEPDQDQSQSGFHSKESMVITEGGDSAGAIPFPPAPEACFKQSIDVVENRFEIGMKLEIPDPKASSNTICIATVADKIGPRLMLKLDGTGMSGILLKLDGTGMFGRYYSDKTRNFKSVNLLTVSFLQTIATSGV